MRYKVRELLLCARSARIFSSIQRKRKAKNLHPHPSSSPGTFFSPFLLFFTRVCFFLPFFQDVAPRATWPLFRGDFSLSTAKKVENFCEANASIFSPTRSTFFVNHHDHERASLFTRATLPNNKNKKRRNSCTENLVVKDDAPRLDEARRFGRFAPTKWSGIFGKRNVIERDIVAFEKIILFVERLRERGEGGEESDGRQIAERHRGRSQRCERFFVFFFGQEGSREDQ